MRMEPSGFSVANCVAPLTNYWKLPISGSVVHGSFYSLAFAPFTIAVRARTQRWAIIEDVAQNTFEQKIPASLYDRHGERRIIKDITQSLVTVLNKRPEHSSWRTMRREPVSVQIRNVSLRIRESKQCAL